MSHSISLLERLELPFLVKVCTAMQEMLDSADDKLYDMSDDDDNDDKSAQFEAMRELRKQRQVIEDAVKSAVAARFTSFLNPQQSSMDEDVAEVKFDFDSLTLVNDDQLELDVTFRNMVSRARQDARGPYGALAARFAEVLGKEVDVDDLPLDPSTICDAFKSATETVELDLKSRLVLYKLFQREVLSVLGEAAVEANDVLKKAGVLAEMTTPRPRRAVRMQNEIPKYEAPSDAADMFASMQDMMSMTQAAIAAQQAQVAALPPIALTDVQSQGRLPVMENGALRLDGQVVQSDSPVQVVAAQELSSMLTQLQQSIEGFSAQQANNLGAEVMDVESGLVDLLDSDDEDKALDKADSDVINLVSMLFDFILDDEDLLPAMKALIGRLQIPLLKVAILDKELFGADNHPARQLLDELAKAGGRWNPSDGDDFLYERIESTVFTVLNEFDDDIVIFSELLVDFKEFLADQSKRDKAREKRLLDEAEGKAKVEACRKQANQEIVKRIANKTLPSEVLAVLQKAWLKVLYMIALREGVESDVWAQQVKVIDILVWCAQAHEKESARDRQKQLIPRLLGSIKKGLAIIQYDAFESDKIIAVLQRVLVGLLKEGQAKSAVHVVPEVRPVSEEPDSGSLALVSKGDGQVAVQLDAEESEDDQLGQDHPAMKWAKHVRVGQWLELKDREPPLRCKVAARLRSNQKVVLINHLSIKVAELPEFELAKGYDAGDIRQVDEKALFDRALESVIGSLREPEPS